MNQHDPEGNSRYSKVVANLTGYLPHPKGFRALHPINIDDEPRKGGNLNRIGAGSVGRERKNIHPALYDVH